jgi:hypothetical protein
LLPVAVEIIRPRYTGQQWEVKTLTDGAISAVEKVRDNSVETKPWLEKTFDYTWSVSAKNGNFKDKLYTAHPMGELINGLGRLRIDLHLK